MSDVLFSASYCPTCWLRYANGSHSMNTMSDWRKKAVTIPAINLLSSSDVKASNNTYLFLWYSRDAKTFQKSRSHLKILGVTRVTDIKQVPN